MRAAIDEVNAQLLRDEMVELIDFDNLDLFIFILVEAATLPRHMLKVA
jgi:hypothetical protein